MNDFSFFLEVLIGGLLSGLMYSLVALGFVLIYKASGVFNFAQGAMVFLAVLSFVGFMELRLPFWVALPVTVMMMVVVGIITERFVLRPLRDMVHGDLWVRALRLHRAVRERFRVGDRRQGAGRVRATHRSSPARSCRRAGRSHQRSARDPGRT